MAALGLNKMNETLRLVLTFIAAPVGAYIMWVKIARPCGAWIIDRIPDGPIKVMLTKDRGGYY